MNFYDAHINQLNLEGIVPRARAFHTADLINDTTLIIYGGVIEEDVETNEIWIYDIDKRIFILYQDSENLKSNFFQNYF